MNSNLIKFLFVVLLFSFKTSFAQGEDVIEETGSNDEVTSFEVIEEVPVFPGCEDVASNLEKKNCMNKKMSKHIARRFNMDVVQSKCIEFKTVDGEKTCVKSEYWPGFSSGKVRLYAKFIIDKEGNVTNIKVQAPHERLKKETERVLKLIPQMEPGKHKGEAVAVGYILPIGLSFTE